MTARRSEYFIDEKGIYSLRSSSYPDAVWRWDHVTFGEAETAERFEKFVQKVLDEGREGRSRELFSLLRQGSQL